MPPSVCITVCACVSLSLLVRLSASSCGSKTRASNPRQQGDRWSRNPRGAEVLPQVVHAVAALESLSRVCARPNVYVFAYVRPFLSICVRFACVHALFTRLQLGTCTHRGISEHCQATSRIVRTFAFCLAYPLRAEEVTPRVRRLRTPIIVICRFLPRSGALCLRQAGLGMCCFKRVGAGNDHRVGAGALHGRGFRETGRACA